MGASWRPSATLQRETVGPVARPVQRPFHLRRPDRQRSAFLEALEIARRASQSDVPILITGESGTGKEMFAQAIHNSAPDTAPSFVGINVAAIRGICSRASCSGTKEAPSPARG